MLRPSGPIGLYLGFVGVALFVGIFLYPIRKHWAWLATKGSTRHWLDIHVLMGLTAPFIIAFHSTLKFRGIAGMAFWIMFAVSTSGVVGRYLYAQIPRKVTTAELSMKELQELQENLAQQLSAQNLLPVADLRALLRMPDANRVSKLPIVVALIYMMILDVIRVFRVARLRRHALSIGESFSTLAGFLPTRHRELEKAIHAAAFAESVPFVARRAQAFQLCFCGAGDAPHRIAICSGILLVANHGYDHHLRDWRRHLPCLSDDLSQEPAEKGDPRPRGC
jgi:hypothetical protein